MNNDWSEILHGEPNPFRGEVHPAAVHVEITLNAPRIDSFTRLLSSGQKAWYRKRYVLLKAMMKSYIYDDSYIFEYCRDGTVHLHACWLVRIPDHITKAGFVSDIVKVWLRTLTKKYNKFNYNYIYFFDNDETTCYKCPSIKCSLRCNQELRFFEWFEYMCKTI